MIDSHCHLDFDSFNGDRDHLLQQCYSAGIEAIVVPGIEPHQWQRLQQLKQAQRHTGAIASSLYLAAGLHPWWVDQVGVSPQILQQLLRQQLEQQQQQWVAIGECGLDGAIECSMARQEAFFEVQLQLAQETGLPLIVHGHKAHQQVIRWLKKFTLPGGGVIHAFSGSRELAQQYWQLGFYIGVGGTISYDRATKTRAAISAMPLESLLLETDAPDMPLSGFQGERNSPLQLLRVAECLADLKSVDVERVSEQTSCNCRHLFGL